MRVAINLCAPNTNIHSVRMRVSDTIPWVGGGERAGRAGTCVIEHTSKRRVCNTCLRHCASPLCECFDAMNEIPCLTHRSNNTKNVGRSVSARPLLVFYCTIHALTIANKQYTVAYIFVRIYDWRIRNVRVYGGIRGPTSRYHAVIKPGAVSSGGGE